MLILIWTALIAGGLFTLMLLLAIFGSCKQSSIEETL
jgi:hypothetical protein